MSIVSGKLANYPLLTAPLFCRRRKNIPCRFFLIKEICFLKIEDELPRYFFQNLVGKGSIPLITKIKCFCPCGKIFFHCPFSQSTHPLPIDVAHMKWLWSSKFWFIIVFFCWVCVLVLNICLCTGCCFCRRKRKSNEINSSQENVSSAVTFFLFWPGYDNTPALTVCKPASSLVTLRPRVS